MHPEIEYFARFAKTYLSWSHVHMDQIVADVVRKHQVAYGAEKDSRKRAQYSVNYRTLAEITRKTIQEYPWRQWDIPKEFLKPMGNVKIGTTLRIKFHSEIPIKPIGQY